MTRQALLIFEDNPGSAVRMGMRVAGLSLLERMVRALVRAGISRLLVVVPASAPLRLSRHAQRLEMAVEFLTWEEASASRSFLLGEGFLVVLGEYVHHHTSLRALVDGGLEGSQLVIQVGDVLPQPGAQRRVLLQAKGVEFSAAAAGETPVSSGAFLCAAGLFSPQQLLEGRADIWSFLSNRARGKQVILRHAAPALWRRVDDRSSARAAKEMLFSQVTKTTSGFISRHLNARLSIPISKVLVETGLSPHMVTVLLVLTTGLSGAYLISRPDHYASLALGGLLWQLAAVLDRCDGEIARVKLCESKFGAWFDTVTDNLAYLCAYVGMLTGMLRIHPEAPQYLYLGISAVIALLVTLAVMYTYAIKTGSGSLQHYLVGMRLHVPESQKGRFYRFVEICGVLAKRDSFSFVFFIAALINWFDFIYWLTVIGLHILALSVLVSQGKMLQSHHAGTGKTSLPVSLPSSSVESRRQI